jgi:nucleoside-diphosphate-sugar epimerase
VTILGAGYTGQALIRQLLDRGYDVRASRRSPAPHGAFPGSVPHFLFDLLREETWHHVPDSWGCVWLFPAEPPAAVQKFLPVLLALSKRIIAIGTTSSYSQQVEDELLTESAPIALDRPRVQGEELLRENGAVILRSAGIYGPSFEGYSSRNPLDWIRRGRMRSLNGYLNLIHVEDLASVIVHALESTVRGDHFIVSDGTPMQWSAMYSWAVDMGFVGRGEFDESRREGSRRLSNAKLLAILQPNLNHIHLFPEIQLLETVLPH